MRIKVLFIVCILLIVSAVNVSAESNIVCSADVTGRDVHVSGQFLEATGECYVAFVVGDSVEEAIYLNQVTSGNDGSFAFDFSFPNDAPKGQYRYIVSSSYGQYVSTIEYNGDVTAVTNPFMDADITVDISSYVPTISGTVSCQYGKTIDIDIVNTTDNTIIADDAVTYSDGEKSLSYQLPSLLNPKDYSVVITCSDGTKNMTVIDVVIDSSIVLVSLDGNVDVAENVQLSLVATGLVDENATIANSKSVSATIPNLVSNASIHLTMQGVETVNVAEPDYDNTDMDNSTSVGINQNFQAIINS